MITVGDQIRLRTYQSSASGRVIPESLSWPEALKDIDVLVPDIQDVGARDHYTYAALALAMMKVCGPLGIEVVVLDRLIQLVVTLLKAVVLNLVTKFCGLFALPQRHGLTVRELAHLYVKAFGVDWE